MPMTPERIEEIMQMSDAEMLPLIQAQALRFREEGQYEKAKLTDDAIELLETSKPNAELTEAEKNERATIIRDIWRRIREIVRQ